jgi:predicted RNA-binding protein associated with RNAse of E/G family
VPKTLAPGSPIHVRKLRPDGSEAFAWDGRVLRCDAQGIVLHAEFNVPLRELGYVTLRRGDVFVEFYYWDRWYNIFQVSQPDGGLKGWYANLGRPAELDPAAGVLSYVDLALDIWANPDNSHVVLDEDELEELLTAAPELRQPAEQARSELLALVEAHQLPHWPPTGA